jgi:hypothetical protein
VSIVNTRGRRVEKTGNPGAATCQKQMRIYKYTQHAYSFIIFDESHSAHVRGQVEDCRRSFNRFLAVAKVFTVGLNILGFARNLIPLIQRLDIDCLDHVNVVVKKAFYQMAADKSAGSADNHFLVLQFHDSSSIVKLGWNHRLMSVKIMARVEKATDYFWMGLSADQTAAR